MTGPNFQAALIEAVKKKIPPHQNLAEVLCSLLHISQNSAYKRIRGHTPLSLDEAIRLCGAYQISLDNILLPEKNTFQASFSGLQAKSSAKEYLQLMESELDLACQDPKTEVWYVTMGLPNFYFYYFDALMIFQFYVWEKMVWENPDWQEKKFSLDIPDKTALLVQARRIANAYNSIKTNEIWNEYILDSIFQQLLYIAESRLYENQEAILTVCLQTGELIKHLKKICLKGSRFMPNGSTLHKAATCRYFYNGIMQKNMFVFKKNAREEEVYMVLDNPNFIKSNDPKIVEQTHLILKKLLRRSAPLDENNEKIRSVFFDKLEKRWQYYTKLITTIFENQVTQPY